MNTITYAIIKKSNDDIEFSCFVGSEDEFIIFVISDIKGKFVVMDKNKTINDLINNNCYVDGYYVIISDCNKFICYVKRRTNIQVGYWYNSITTEADIINTYEMIKCNGKYNNQCSCNTINNQLKT